MNILSYWLESFKLVSFSHVKLYFLVTLNSAKQLLNNRLFWIFYLSLGVSVLGYHYFLATSATALYSFSIPVLSNIARGLIIFFIALLTRASIKPKKTVYFLSYLRKFWLPCIVTVLFSISMIDFIPLFFLYYLFFLFLVLDSDGIFYRYTENAQAAFRMIYYNAPVIFIINILLLFFDLMVFAFALLTCIDFSLWYLIYTPIKILLSYNLYLLMLYEQSKYYFKEP